MLHRTTVPCEKGGNAAGGGAAASCVMPSDESGGIGNCIVTVITPLFLKFSTRDPLTFRGAGGGGAPYDCCCCENMDGTTDGMPADGGGAYALGGGAANSKIFKCIEKARNRILTLEARRRRCVVLLLLL